MVIQRLRPMFSGQGVQVEELCRELAARGVQVTILTAGQGRQPRWESIDGYRVRRLRADIPLLSRRLRPGRLRSEIFGIKTLLWLLLHGWRTQIIHAHAQSDALYTAWLFSRMQRAPLIFEMTLLGTDDAGSFAANRHRLARLRNALFRRCDGFVAISPALVRTYEGSGLPADKLRLIPQGVDAERFQPAADKSALRRTLGLPADVPLLVFVGSLIERKGIDVLLDAWERIQLRFPDATLALVGRDAFDGDAASTDFLRVQLAGLTAAARSRVVLAGVQDAVEHWLAAADVFVFPSRREGFGTVMIEAMACALPCVVAELPDITDFIFDGGEACGIVVPQNDAEALAARVGELLDDPTRRAALGAAARRRAVERFAIERIADDYLDFYAHLAQPAGA
jgi:glycosyltransferase involved in cell wall biosynthesis